MREEDKYLIKDVAKYIRKSRGDTEKDLENHRLALDELCTKNGWDAVEYAEIGSSDSIQDRPKFKELLEDIEHDLFDAIVVVDIDRLGRGDDSDWSVIEKKIRENEILIVTPNKIYNLENDEDETMLDFKKFFARLEYKQISKRLRRGKIWGAKKGYWTNGKPPYPYIYNRQTKNLDIDENKRDVYRMIIERALVGRSAEEIAWELNELGHKSPGGKEDWSSTAVYRLLFDMTHLGKIVFGKQKGSGHKNKKTKPLKMFAKEDWIIVQGRHTPLKTQEEHDKIMELFAKRKFTPKASRHGAFVLSGLVYCGKCGYSMQFTFNGNSNIEYVKKCQTKDRVGNRCGNSGVNTQILIDAVFRKLEEQEEELQSKKYNVNEKELEILKTAIEEKKIAIKKEEKALDRLQEQREDGEITKERFLERKEVRENVKRQLQREIIELEERCSRREQVSDEKRLKTIREFYELWNSTDNVKDKNTFLKTIVDKISYTRDGNSVWVDVNFL